MRGSRWLDHQGSRWAPQVMTPWQDDLETLRWHWGDAYEILWANGQFHAKRRDNGKMLHAETAEDMYKVIAQDYQAKPVPRVRDQSEWNLGE